MSNHNKVTAAALLVTLGIIYGDIGTSPLYVMKAIIEGRDVTEQLILGGLSCIFWTISLQTTLKYVIFTLRADNKGEGGIFSLYTLVRKQKKWLVIPAIIGGCNLLADGIITPPISVASAVEGLKVIPQFHDINTIPIILAIIVLLFVLQQFGTKSIGNLFGPVMFIWFTMLAVLGFGNIIQDWSILRCLNPYYAYDLLANYPQGFWLLGAVFLCTTGAEALYSDLGHCGKKNVRLTWGFVKLSLILNYMGQGAWLLNNKNAIVEHINPFYAIMPSWFVLWGIGVATVAAVVASQAMISGSFTLINEAIRLNLWPKVKINYPTDQKGQLYIPSLNWMLMTGCIIVVLYFRESSKMEAAYGLAIVLTMMMTTTLLVFYFLMNNYNKIFIAAFFLIYSTIESSFLIANLTKFTDGGFVTIMIAFILFLVMWIWFNAKKIKNRFDDIIPFEDQVPILAALSADESVPKYATHLVYLTSANDASLAEKKVLYSILQKQPKRADIYWFIHIEVLDEPYGIKYKVNTLAEDDVIRLDFYLGFREEPKVNVLLRKAIEEMVEKGEVNTISRYESLKKFNIQGDFRFVVTEKYLSNDNDFPLGEKIIMNLYVLLKKISMSEEQAFGLDTSSVVTEKVPMVIRPMKKINLERIQ